MAGPGGGSGADMGGGSSGECVFPEIKSKSEHVCLSFA